MSNKKTQSSILVLYDSKSTHVQTIYDSVKSFGKFSRYNVCYADATSAPEVEKDIDLNKYVDVVILHFSVRLHLEDYFNESWALALGSFCGPKLVFLQDEFDVAEVARKWLERIRPNVVYSIIPQDSIGVVYPKERFPDTEFKTVLAGYIPDEFLSYDVKPLCERDIVIGYRGRDLPYWYGKLAQEKMNIGVKGKSICQELSIPHDIEWESSKRIYGKDWFDFLESIQVMLGTEGGANILDEYGAIKASVEAILSLRPEMTFEEVYPLYLRAHEGRIRTNQLTPKIFEAISLKTGLLLFEGAYSGIIEPHKHYIPLRKDFSNFSECYAKIQDKKYLRDLTERAFSDIVKSGKYLVSTFVSRLDDEVEGFIGKGKNRLLKNFIVKMPKALTDEIKVYYN